MACLLNGVKYTAAALPAPAYCSAAENSGVANLPPAAVAFPSATDRRVEIVQIDQDRLAAIAAEIVGAVEDVDVQGRSGDPGTGLEDAPIAENDQFGRFADRTRKPAVWRQVRD